MQNDELKGSSVLKCQHVHSCNLVQVKSLGSSSELKHCSGGGENRNHSRQQDLGRTKEALLVMEYCDKSLVSVLESRGVGDLKAENLLLGPDGLWKLCDFGSTSMNHKRFERPEEMGIEEDNIRNHKTAYRSPEMWDLLLREVISEKVDIWALGCLLFRICYFKYAFDGESKLQVLSGNYRMTDLIRDMLQSSPTSRPYITQARALLVPE
ncbi:hypothetical protein L6452_05771 [Arctium lappa]|uniref:Uncharacterized protein n=1 Tax=Arctium lappa TaxID=4217 RepID=A0ACB9EI05_ARCLA|nr:hypothetical protein L6452_05771 [Arctium lappa]